MTSPFFVERGVHKEMTTKCIECMHRRVIHAGDISAVILICENERSDHYGHVLNGSVHPTCCECEIIEII
jgi:hypothetical protein